MPRWSVRCGSNRFINFKNLSYAKFPFWWFTTLEESFTCFLLLYPLVRSLPLPSALGKGRECLSACMPYRSQYRLYCRPTLYPSLCEGRTNAPPSPPPRTFLTSEWWRWGTDEAKINRVRWFICCLLPCCEPCITSGSFRCSLLHHYSMLRHGRHPFQTAAKFLCGWHCSPWRIEGSYLCPSS